MPLPKIISTLHISPATPISDSRTPDMPNPIHLAQSMSTAPAPRPTPPGRPPQAARTPPAARPPRPPPPRREVRRRQAR